MADILQEEGFSEQEDATMEISRTELDAIRQSASDGEFDRQQLRKLNEQRVEHSVQQQSSGNPDPPQDQEDLTNSMDRKNLDSVLRGEPPRQSAARTQGENPPQAAILKKRRRLDESSGPASSKSTGEEGGPSNQPDSDDLGDLSELSDADMHAVVFGDDDPSTSPADGGASRGDEAIGAGGTASGPSTPHESTHQGLDDPAQSVAPQPAATGQAAASDGESQASAPTEGGRRGRPDGADGPPTSNRSAAESTSSRPASDSAQPSPSSVADQPLQDFRTTTSRLLMFGITLSGGSMVIVGGVRLGTHDMLRMVHPMLAGVMVAVGFMFLLGALASFLERR